MPKGPTPEPVCNHLGKIGVIVAGYPVCEDSSSVFGIHVGGLYAEEGGRLDCFPGLGILVLIVVRQLELLTAGFHNFVSVEIAQEVAHFAGDSPEEVATGLGPCGFVLGFERPVHAGMILP